MNSIPRVMSLYLVRHFILFLYLLILNGCFSLIAQTKDEMVLIPEGVFTMGYNIKNKNEWGDTDEGPVHKVFLKPYYIGRYEVSVSQFSKFLNHHQKKVRSHRNLLQWLLPPLNRVSHWVPVANLRVLHLQTHMETGMLFSLFNQFYI